MTENRDMEGEGSAEKREDEPLTNFEAVAILAAVSVGEPEETTPLLESAKSKLASIAETPQS